MWRTGGLTEDENLITLRHPCHDGLDPYEDFDLFELIDPARLSNGVEGSRRGISSTYLHLVWGRVPVTGTASAIVALGGVMG